MKKKYKIRIRIWIDEEDGAFLGIGRVVLLEKIKKYGSISKAAKSIKMSYRQAWQLVKDMNCRAEKPLVEKLQGGKGGGGAMLTEYGELAIKSFYLFEKKVSMYASKEKDNLFLFKK